MGMQELRPNERMQSPWGHHGYRQLHLHDPAKSSSGVVQGTVSNARYLVAFAEVKSMIQVHKHNLVQGVFEDVVYSSLNDAVKKMQVIQW